VCNSSEGMRKWIVESRAQIEALKKKHNIDNDQDAIMLEREELEKKWQPSEDAIAYIKDLNQTYQGKNIKFYYNDSMLKMFSIDDPDCSHIPVYEELCESIELIATETRKVPMIITKNKNYSLIGIVDLTILPLLPIIKQVLQKFFSKSYIYLTLPIYNDTKFKQGFLTSFIFS